MGVTTEVVVIRIGIDGIDEGSACVTSNRNSLVQLECGTVVTEGAGFTCWSSIPIFAVTSQFACDVAVSDV